MRTIAIEEHFVTEGFMQGPGCELRAMAEAVRAHPKVAAGYAKLVEGLRDLGEGRVAAMDKAGVDMQVLSLTSPGVEQLGAGEAVALAREANDALAGAVRNHPDRFAGFATLPTPSPEAAADELERAVGDHGFVGALINGHAGGRYMDDPFFWPILERAEALGVPIYLHPTPPPRTVVEASYTGNFAPGVAEGLAAAAWGWHLETATHVLRIILGGAFDRFPRLQLVVGHMGEGLPFFLPRLELALPEMLTKLERPVGEYLRENVHYTFGGFNWPQPFLDLLLQVGVERVMFSADHPYASMEEACTFLDQLPVGTADRGKIAHRNAERLLGL
jgi:predicted TIM-barrel fold metal-dependent hydrolase